MKQTLSNAKYLTLAAKELNIPFSIIDDNGNYIVIEKNDQNYHFVNNKAPFNSGGINLLCKDKDFTYKFISDELKMPKSKGYLNPNVQQKYKHYLKFFAKSEIISDIKDNFNFPVVVKMNKGSLARNVFMCYNDRQVKRALRNIFDKKSRLYDYIALVQEAIDIKREFRVIWFRGEIILLYEKKWEHKNESLSPLHNTGSYSEIIDKDSEISKKIKDFLKQSNKLNDIEFCGIDIAIDDKNEIWLLELNSSPGFGSFLESDSESAIIEMYKEILQKL